MPHNQMEQSVKETNQINEVLENGRKAHAFMSARSNKRTPLLAHAFTSARLYERTPLRAHAFTSARL